MLMEALEYACDGWAVFPVHSVEDGLCTCGDPECRHPGKHPRTVHGFKDATRDEAEIHQLWQQWPDSNIGGATGAASGRVVLDVDAPLGEESLEALEREHGELPMTPISLTGGGGYHFVFRRPGHPVRSSNGKLGQGLDVKGDGGYVVLPPSRHRSGRCYAWNAEAHPDDVGVAPLPKWIEKGVNGTPTCA